MKIPQRAKQDVGCQVPSAFDNLKPFVTEAKAISLSGAGGGSAWSP